MVSGYFRVLRGSDGLASRGKRVKVKDGMEGNGIFGNDDGLRSFGDGSPETPVSREPGIQGCTVGVKYLRHPRRREMKLLREVERRKLNVYGSYLNW